MIRYNPEKSRGRGNHSWLQANHSFSFANYYNPDRMGYKALKVINEDFVQPSTGFPTHGHRNMEIVTFVISGSLTHKDSMGNIAILEPGRIQRMYAGSGVRHSEYNASADKVLNLFQIWIEPNQNNLPPEYNELEFDNSKKNQLLVSGTGDKGSIKIYQNTELWVIRLQEFETIDLDLWKSNYIHVVEGQIELDGKPGNYGDSFEIEDLSKVQIVGKSNARLLVFKF